MAIPPPLTKRSTTVSGDRLPNGVSADVAQFRHHPRGEMRHVMAMEHPLPGIYGVEGDRDPSHRRDVNGIPDGSRIALRPKADHLEDVAVQVHRVRHHGSILHRQLDPLTLPRLEDAVPTPRPIVDRPGIGRHAAVQRDAESSIRALCQQWVTGVKPQLLRAVEGC